MSEDKKVSFLRKIYRLSPCLILVIFFGWYFFTSDNDLQILLVGIFLVGINICGACGYVFWYVNDRREKRIADDIDNPDRQKEYIEKTGGKPIKKGKFSPEYIEWLVKLKKKTEIDNIS